MFETGNAMADLVLVVALGLSLGWCVMGMIRDLLRGG